MSDYQGKTIQGFSRFPIHRSRVLPMRRSRVGHPSSAAARRARDTGDASPTGRASRISTFIL